MDFHPIDAIKQHPVVGGIAVFGIGFVVLYMLGFFRPAQASTDAGGAAAYYSAVTADAVSGNQLQMATVNANAATQIAQISADTSTTNNTTWANTQLAEANGQNAVTIATAPYSFYNNLVGTLGNIAAKPGGVVTSTDNGFFGIGGGTSSSYVPDPAAVSAADQLSHLEAQFLSQQTFH